MSEMVPMTKEAYNRLRAEIEQMEMVEMPRIAEKIAEARAEGDLKENAEYHAQRENQGQTQAKINARKEKLANAYIIDPTKLNRDVVSVMATVKVRDVEYDDEEEFSLVGSGDEDYDAGKILSSSPIGSALLGRKVGDNIEVPLPKGKKLRYEILSIDYPLLDNESKG